MLPVKGSKIYALTEHNLEGVNFYVTDFDDRYCDWNSAQISDKHTLSPLRTHTSARVYKSSQSVDKLCLLNTSLQGQMYSS